MSPVCLQACPAVGTRASAVLSQGRRRLMDYFRVSSGILFPYQEWRYRAETSRDFEFLRS